MVPFAEVPLLPAAEIGFWEACFRSLVLGVVQVLLVLTLQIEMGLVEV